MSYMIEMDAFTELHQPTSDSFSIDGTLVLEKRHPMTIQKLRTLLETYRKQGRRVAVDLNGCVKFFETSLFLFGEKYNTILPTHSNHALAYLLDTPFFDRGFESPSFQYLLYTDPLLGDRNFFCLIVPKSERYSVQSHANVLENGRVHTLLPEQFPEWFQELNTHATETFTLKYRLKKLFQSDHYPQ